MPKVCPAPLRSVNPHQEAAPSLSSFRLRTPGIMGFLWILVMRCVTASPFSVSPILLPASSGQMEHARRPSGPHANGSHSLNGLKMQKRELSGSWFAPVSPVSYRPNGLSGRAIKACWRHFASAHDFFSSLKPGFKVLEGVCWLSFRKHGRWTNWFTVTGTLNGTEPPLLSVSCCEPVTWPVVNIWCQRLKHVKQ